MVAPVAVDALYERVETLLDGGDIETVAGILRRIHPADSSDILYRLPPEYQSLVLHELPWEEAADVLEELNQEEMVEVVQGLSLPELADVLDEMEPDMAADLIGELEDDQAAELLEEMEAAEGVVRLLEYPADCAGGIMNSPRHMLRRDMTAGQAMQFLRNHYEDEHDLHYLYVLEDEGRPAIDSAALPSGDRERLVGIVSLRTLILADPTESLEAIMDGDLLTVGADADQEEVARLLSRYNLLAVPVVDDERHLLGIVAVDDLVDVLEEEATEDIYRLAQMSGEAVVFSPIRRAVRTRLPWLAANLGTALISSTVVAQFAGTIAAYSMLAALMPVVAAQGGNAGNQAMTIMVRSLALGQIDLRDFWRVFRHEAGVGLLHGLALGLLLAAVVYAWLGNPVLSAVIGTAMLGNFLVAAAAGVAVPMALRRLGVDPALGSSMMVTASTDILGFALFLGLASYFIVGLIG
ncbi:MAG: magnesium transporter [Caldilineaceae bacterium]|nr:magnesium transporter [Caldilineaceae bacterium]